MSVKSDISQLSGISAISSISCSSSAQQNQQTYKQSAYKEHSLDKTLNDLAKCEETICQAAHIKLIYETLEEIMENPATNVSPELLKKLKQVVLAYRIDKYFKLPSNHKQGDDKLTLLGIMEISKPEFSHEEKRIIKSTLETELLKKINSFIAKYEESGGNLIEAMGNSESLARQELAKLNDSIVPHWKDKLDEMSNEYYRDILICADLLNEWQRLKDNDVEDLNFKTAQTKLLQAEIAELQGKITKLRCTVKMFQETPITLNAFKKLDSCIQEKLIDVQTEIKKKVTLLNEYTDLKGTEYDEILKRYNDLCSTIEKDERLLNSL